MSGQRRKLTGLGLAVGWMVGLAAIPSSAQQRERSAKSDAPLIVEGVLRQVFRSPRQGRIDYLLEIDVERSEGRKSPGAGIRSRFPGPGEPVYVHLAQRLDSAGRPVPRDSHREIPAERAQLRAYLVPRERGGWEGAFPDWFDLTDDRPAEISPTDPAPGIADDSPVDSGSSRLGMTTELLKVQDETALRVTSVERGGAAQEAGLEVGDILAATENGPLKDAAQLEALADQGMKFTLVVVDVNTGRAAHIEVDPGQRPAVAGESGGSTDRPPRVSLGISGESVVLGTRSALKVTRVEAGGPAAKAGLEPGDIVVAANGAPVTGPEQLLSALRKSGPTLTLTVRDSRTGRDVKVDVLLGGTKPLQPLPAEADTPQAVSPGSLGAVTELAFHDDEFAVQVTEIEAGSPADRAGLRPGVLILAANGEPVLHPNELTAAVRKSGGPLELTVIDPATGKKSTLDVELEK